MSREIIYPRGRIRYTEWIMERRVLIACVLGALCFAIGYLAAGPRIHAGNRAAYVPPGIAVQPHSASAPSSNVNSPMAPDIDIAPATESISAKTEIEEAPKASESRKRRAERPRRKKLTRPKPIIESKEPVVVYAPPPSKPEETSEEPFPREPGRDPEIDP